MSRFAAFIGAIATALGTWGLISRPSSGVPAEIPGAPRSSTPTPRQRPAATVAPASFNPPTQSARGRLSFNEAKALALKITRTYFPSVDPKMLVAMMQIESSFDPRATRSEPHVRNRFTTNGDKSYGLMQVLYTTALDLFHNMGRKGFSVATPDRLFDPTVNVYFGAAYVAWLQNYRGTRRSEDWIVMSYNGGPGANNSQTQNHLAKYHDAKRAQAGGW
ncbi:transglycosylase SLT domain-containing protein [Parvibaculaceae bacterium PLY_AMNH_Bact1]|nr:transglycosylase SLT domain-containing protein [Parvibaculaceae bacterium PLY_AMNH_Bact1]